jgi:hypothetical protein
MGNETSIILVVVVVLLLLFVYFINKEKLKEPSAEILNKFIIHDELHTLY